MEDIIGKIIAEIEYDISDRRGLKQEWLQIDDDVKEEIRDAWRAIIERHIETITG